MPADLQNEHVVSVVIPCYRQARFLGDAIESALAQTHARVEVVVVDDGSPDDTAAVAARYPEVRYVRQENHGLSAARNAGLCASSGDFVVFLDADDVLRRDAVRAGLAALLARPECAFASGAYVYVDENRLPLPSTHGSRIVRDHYTALLRDNYIGMHATVMYRRAPLVTAGGFDTRLGACEDYDLYLRLAREFPVCTHDRVIAEYRQHGANMSGDVALMLRAVLRVLRAQRGYVKGCGLDEEALAAGMRSWRVFYGEQMARQVRTLAAEGRWLRAFRAALALARHHPRGLASRVRGLAGRLVPFPSRALARRHR
jgi:glycosyltransferase involved in cell wall biosynthesis